MRHVMGTSRDREPSAQLTDQALAAEVTRKARCADGTVDPDEWFPVSTEAEAARREAAGAIAICTACPVRGACLELSLRHWTIGQHGVWGGLVAADRVALRRRWLASPHEYGRAVPIQARALAQRQGPDEVLATSGSPAGSAVTVWLDASGKLTRPPLQPGQVTDRAITVAAEAPAVLTLSLLTALLIAQRLADRRRLAAWDAAWSTVGPQWTRRRP